MQKMPKLKIEGMPLQRRLLISSLLGTIPLILFSALMLFSWFTERHVRVMTNNEQQAQMASVYLDEWLNGHSRTLRTLAESQEAKSGDLNEIKGMLARQSHAQPDWDHLFVTDATGMQVVNTAEKIVDVSDRSYFIQVKATLLPAFSSLITSRTTGHKVIIIAYPIMHEGKFIGIIGASILPDAIQKLFSIHQSDQEVKFSLWDRDGTLLVRSGEDKDLIGKQYVVPEANIVLTGRGGKIIMKSPIDKKMYIAGYSPVHAAPWTVFAATPERATMLPIIKQIIVFALLAFIVMITTLWWSLKSADMISSQVKQLANGAQEIGAGNFATRITIDGGGELGVLAESINKMAVDLAMQERLKADFLSLMSHELKTPLTTVRAFLEMMVTGTVMADTEHYAEMVKSADRQARRLQDMIENILSIARLEFGGLVVIPHPTALKNIINASMSQYQEPASEKNITMTVDSVADVKVNADPTKVTLILNNLLDNAVKFTNEGGAIIIRVQLAEKEATISVIDNGIGLAPEVKERLFEAFYQREPILTRSTGGAGLGLPVAKALVEAHKGIISVVSDGTDKGSTFSFTLPLA
ncbi:MAG: sensor histidine kinase [bacterium]